MLLGGTETVTTAVVASVWLLLHVSRQQWSGKKNLSMQQRCYVCLQEAASTAQIFQPCNKQDGLAVTVIPGETVPFKISLGDYARYGSFEKCVARFRVGVSWRRGWQDMS